MTPAISVLVVSYNTRELTLACLGSVQETTPDLDLEVVVVDNASKDGSAEAIGREFPEMKLIANAANLGFAGANNLAAKEARGEWILLLNPDTIVRPGAIQALLACAQANPGAGVIGGRTLFEDGSLNPTSCWKRMSVWSLFCMGTGLSAVFRGSALFDPESMGAWGRDTERQVDIVTGCLAFLSRSLWEELGGFDERFFMYGEDADLSLRAAERGRTCRVTPAAEIVHLGGRSERVRSDKMTKLFRARCQVLVKHEPAGTARFGSAMHSAWAFSRMAIHGLLALAFQSRRPSFRAWRDTWARRGEWSYGAVRRSMQSPPLDPITPAPKDGSSA